jgi:pyridoxal phosphate enzyme (YggS family)
VASRLAAVRTAIAVACERSNRAPQDVLLIGATKTVPIDRIAEAVAAGLTDLGENRAVELAEKAGRVDPGVAWHFLGKLQTGTVARVAAFADVVHSAEPGRAMERLSRRLERDGRIVPVLIEVDFTGRRQGVAPEEVAVFADEISRFGGVRLCGLMTLPPPTPDREGARPYFRRVRELRDGLLDRHPDAMELSMGMSGDYTIAVEEGATMVRVGTAIFGPRPGADTKG